MIIWKVNPKQTKDPQPKKSTLSNQKVRIFPRIRPLCQPGFHCETERRGYTLNERLLRANDENSWGSSNFWYIFQNNVYNERNSNLKFNYLFFKSMVVGAALVLPVVTQSCRNYCLRSLISILNSIALSTLRGHFRLCSFSVDYFDFVVDSR